MRVSKEFRKDRTVWYLTPETPTDDAFCQDMRTFIRSDSHGRYMACFSDRDRHGGEDGLAPHGILVAACDPKPTGGSS